MDNRLFCLISHGEGYSPRPYLDTHGYWTWGIGRCYQNYPLTLRERRRVVELCPMKQSPESEWGLDLTTFILSQIPPSEATILASFFVDDVLGEIIPRLKAHFPWWKDELTPRQAVWIDWSYNMGLSAIRSWNGTPRDYAAGKFDAIAKDCLTWPWARQVGKNPPDRNNPFGQRAWYISEMMRTNLWPAWTIDKV